MTLPLWAEGLVVGMLVALPHHAGGDIKAPGDLCKRHSPIFLESLDDLAVDVVDPTLNGDGLSFHRSYRLREKRPNQPKPIVTWIITTVKCVMMIYHHLNDFSTVYFTISRTN